MYMIKRIIEAFASPPGLYVIILLVAGAIFFRSRMRKPAWFCLVMSAFIWVVSTMAFSNMVFGWLEGPYEKLPDTDGDVIILLGGGVNDSAFDITGKGAPGDEMMSRLVAAARLQKRLGVPIIMSGGSVRTVEISEGEVVARVLNDLGVSRENLILEGKSIDTEQNGLFTAGICREKGFKRPLLVTSAAHMRRSEKMFTDAGVRVVPVPAAFKHDRSEKGLIDFLPWYTPLFQGTHELLGLLFYELKTVKNFE